MQSRLDIDLRRLRASPRHRRSSRSLLSILRPDKRRQTASILDRSLPPVYVFIPASDSFCSGLLDRSVLIARRDPEAATLQPAAERQEAPCTRFRHSRPLPPPNRLRSLSSGNRVVRSTQRRRPSVFVNSDGSEIIERPHFGRVTRAPFSEPAAPHLRSLITRRRRSPTLPKY
uniref:ZP domain-containing protein n=1 Tax=Steinernema glaseri TaxID=37863 RepID=A0A1I7ZLR4_9BILA